MASTLDKERPNAYFTFPDGYLNDNPKLTNLTEMEMVKILQGADNSVKIPLLKSLVYRTSKGEHFPKILMSLMNCLTNDNKVVKKLTMYIWENVNRYDAQGKLISEAILICNALKTNLEHPNEYIRGAALRLVSKLLDIELLDPILPTIILNLDHHHVYVRRHALMCIQHIASHSEELNSYISHLEDKIYSILTTEYNQTCRYHALITLTALSIDRAVEFFDTISNSLHLQQPGLFIEAILHLISKTYQTHRKSLPSYINALTLLLHKITPGIGNYIATQASGTINTNTITFNTNLDFSTIYSIAQTLLIISSNEASIQLGLNIFIILLKNDNNNNNSLKSLIIDSLTLFSQQQIYSNLLSPFVIEILSILPLCDLSIKEHILDLTLRLCSHSNVESIASALRKEYLSVQDEANNEVSSSAGASATTTNMPLLDDNVGDITLRHQVAGSSQQQYRHVLFKTLHTLSIQHPTVLPAIAPLLSLSIADPNQLTSLNAMKLIREIILVHKPLRKSLLEKMCEKFSLINTPEILRGVVWMLGEFTGTDMIANNTNNNNIEQFVPLPIQKCDKNDINMLYNITTFLIHAIGLESFNPQQQLFEYQQRMKLNENAAAKVNVEFDPIVFHQQSNLMATNISHARSLIYNGDMHFATVFSTTLTKLLLKIYNYHVNITPGMSSHQPQNNKHYQQIQAMVVLIHTRLLKFIPKVPLTELPANMPQPPPQSIHKAVNDENFLNSIGINNDNGSNNDIDATFNTLSVEQFQFFPESSYLGIGNDSFERIAMNLKVLLYPNEFGYLSEITTQSNPHHDMIFATSTQVLQQAIRYEHKQDVEMKKLSFSSSTSSLSTTTTTTSSSSSSQSTDPTNTNNTVPVDIAQIDPTTTTTATISHAIASNSGNKSGSTGLKISSAGKRTIHRPVAIRLLRKNLDDHAQRLHLNIPTQQEDLNLAVTGSKGGNIYNPTLSSSSSTSASTTTTMATFDQKSKSRPVIYQLTGLSDLVYAEAKVTIQMYDVILELTAINQSSTTLQNVSLELQCSNDLTLATPPQSFSLAPRNTLITTQTADGSNIVQNRSQHQCTLRFNVNNTETGLICGNIVCDTSNGNNKHIIALQPVVIDISQYLTPSSCLSTDYRSMWSEFEWENKVLISTNFTNPIQFIQYITTLTHMHCLTPLDSFITQQQNTQITTAIADEEQQQQDKQQQQLLQQQPEFVAANLYALSSFGEQALLNISVESMNGRLTGCMRVRAKTRGVARSLGDLIKNKQRM